ncbi:MAG TPA: (2Fe-2S) ferredoxin domain-containing protein [Bacteroidia bacterium]|nr:(2Fe-2S) ferredoxin domain-containing protein [Bacteroidia bacterium]
MRFSKHVFICTNERKNSDRKSCGEATGMELVHEFKRLIKEKGLKETIRSQRAGCLDACEFGPSVAVYPEGIFYGGVQLSDVEQIVIDHLINNKPVERLIINFNKIEQPRTR